MYKLSFYLGKINDQMKLTFSLIVSQENTSFGNKFPNYKENFSWAGNQFLRFQPNPYITISINNLEDKKQGIQNSVNLNKYGVFRFSKELEAMKEKFITIKELFYYYGDKLVLNKEVVKEKRVISTFTTNGKRICIQPVVVEDQDTGLSHEGIAFFINSIDSFCYLTYAEMEYLRYLLTHTDIDSLSMLLIQSYENTISHKNNAITKKVEMKPIDEDILDNNFVRIKEESTIPGI